MSDRMKMTQKIITEASGWTRGTVESPLIIVPEDRLVEIIDGKLGYLHGALSYVKMFLDERVSRGDAPAIFGYVESALEELDGSIANDR